MFWDVISKSSVSQPSACLLASSYKLGIAKRTQHNIKYMKQTTIYPSTWPPSGYRWTRNNHRIVYFAYHLITLRCVKILFWRVYVFDTLRGNLILTRVGSMCSITIALWRMMRLKSYHITPITTLIQHIVNITRVSWVAMNIIRIIYMHSVDFRW